MPWDPPQVGDPSEEQKGVSWGKWVLHNLGSQWNFFSRFPDFDSQFQVSFRLCNFRFFPFQFDFRLTLQVWVWLPVLPAFFLPIQMRLWFRFTEKKRHVGKVHLIDWSGWFESLGRKKVFVLLLLPFVVLISKVIQWFCPTNASIEHNTGLPPWPEGFRFESGC
jgi:hypothetical protein